MNRKGAVGEVRSRKQYVRPGDLDGLMTVDLAGWVGPSHTVEEMMRLSVTWDGRFIDLADECGFDG